MKLRKIWTTAVFLLLVVPIGILGKDAKPEAKAHFELGQKASRARDHTTAIAEFRKAIEIDPDYLEAHEQFIRVSQRANAGSETDVPNKKDEEAADKARAELVTLYEGWIKQHPDKAVYPYALGTLYEYRSFPTQEKYCLKAIQIDPKFAPAYFRLSLIAEFKGDEKGSREYLRKAAASDPGSPDFAFYYSNKLKDSDAEQYRRTALEVAERFPASERGAQSLYWLGTNLEKPQEKIAVFEQLEKRFPPEKFSWSSSGMSQLFDVYAKEDPLKALELAKKMAGLKPDRTWSTLLALQQTMVDARRLLDQGEALEAVGRLETAKAPTYGGSAMLLALLKAEAADASGDGAKAYDALLRLSTAEPGDTLIAALLKYAAKTNRGAKEVDADLWELRSAKATVPVPFALAGYEGDKKYSLEDFEGKVVLLNFWYPG